jgi:hypothetical protein
MEPSWCPAPIKIVRLLARALRFVQNRTTTKNITGTTFRKSSNDPRTWRTGCHRDGPALSAGSDTVEEAMTIVVNRMGEVIGFAIGRHACLSGSLNAPTRQSVSTLA